MGQKRLTGDFAPVTVISENRKDDRKRNMIKHVLFDLDGTLLPMDQNEFVRIFPQRDQTVLRVCIFLYTEIPLFFSSQLWYTHA